MEEKIEFTADSRLGKALQQWWAGLEEDRASRAVLKRCATVDEVALSEAYQRFYRYMRACGWPENAAGWQLDKLAAIAGLLSHIKVHDNLRLPESMSEGDGDKNRVSELRFRDILKAQDTDDLFVGLRRLLPLINHQTSIYHLAQDVYHWNNQYRNIPKAWAYAYRWEPNTQSA